mmetsp:Transcript_9900/g.27043  ORF Transcript_9900/g.27043 Transcript_9900/m.27043 type:complete len:130 (-) Transcript_9900:371-760(-)|eukprot:CAMPEP_0198119906 /NCGR_PEP_ID=MMETSP1442-20131203/27388_1 /TAXON_ID= /ORGANISM="Craspedostauros australis, Strain CCMP3328" /LENGTH=129 /DNA_ID=CAMNT_0043778465 /DNA_START=297 /DNA_END=686 /DNA_ORIENTATION=+
MTVNHFRCAAFAMTMYLLLKFQPVDGRRHWRFGVSNVIPSSASPLEDTDTKRMQENIRPVHSELPPTNTSADEQDPVFAVQHVSRTQRMEDGAQGVVPPVSPPLPPQPLPRDPKPYRHIPPPMLPYQYL